MDFAVRAITLKILHHVTQFYYKTYHNVKICWLEDMDQTPILYQGP